MSEDVDVPKVGAVPKRTLLVIGGGAAGFVLWRYWRASKAAAAATPTDPGFGDGGTIPAVAGAGGPATGIPLPTTPTAPTTGDFGFHGTTNDQWTQYAATQLTSSDVWSYTDIVTALGAYLAGRPLTATQQQIVQAAIAIAGQPPQGAHPVIPGGDVPILVAPTGVTASADSDSAITVTWSAVAGATSYHVYRSTGDAVTTVTGTRDTVSGLSPATAYGFQVAAATGSGQIGPKSSVASATTKAAPPPVVSKPFNPPKPKPPKPKGPPPYTDYVVRHGDTLSGIAAAHHSSVQAIWDFNQKWRLPATAALLRERTKNRIYAGEHIWIPK